MLVVSPLVALMIDRVKRLRKRNVKAAIISDGAGGVDKQLLTTKTDLARCSLLYGALISIPLSTMEHLAVSTTTSRVVVEKGEVGVKLIL